MSWKSTLQSTIALFTTEVKYTTLTKTVKEAIWLEELLDELRLARSISLFILTVKVLFV